MNLYETELWARDRLEHAREFAAREAMIRKALPDRPTVRLWLGALFIRLGTWLQGRVPDPDGEAKRAPA